MGLADADGNPVADKNGFFLESWQGDQHGGECELALIVDILPASRRPMFGRK